MPAISIVLLTVAMHAATAKPMLVVSQCDIEQIVALPVTDALEIASRIPSPSWLEIDEDGVDVAISSSPLDAIELTVPPRYGRFYVPMRIGDRIEVKRAPVSGWSSKLKIVARCANRNVDVAELGWASDAAGLSKKLLPVPQADPEALLKPIAEFSANCPSATCLAIARHLRAQTYYAAGRTLAAAEAFAEAEKAWHLAGDSGRALAARTGRVEELIQASRYGEALSAIRSVRIDRELVGSYFAVRLSATECLVREYEGQLAAAARCYRSVANRQESDATERAGTLINLASVQYLAGNLTEAERNAAESRTSADGPYAPIVRGRAALLLADIQTDRADVSEAFASLDNAISEFVALNETRWEGNTLLKAASLYTQLGAIEEARMFSNTAIELFPENDAPARFAAAEVVSARTSLKAAQYEDALDAARRASVVYSTLRMPVELDIAQVVSAQAQIGLGDLDAAMGAYHSRDTKIAISGTEWSLIGAQIDALQNRPRDASNKLAEMRNKTLSLSAQLRKVEIEARIWQDNGDDDRALEKVLSAAASARKLANRMHSRLLANVLLAQLIPLRQLAVDFIAEEVKRSNSRPRSEVLQQAWRLLWLTGGADNSDRESSPPKDQQTFDDLVAHQLLNPSKRRNDDPEGARALLALLAQPFYSSSTRAQPDFPSIARLQSTLRDDTVFVAYLGGTSGAIMLWIGQSRADVTTISRVSDLHTAVDSVSNLAADFDTPISAVQAAAETVSKLLLDRAPMSQPSKLIIEASSDLATIPWGLLSWPGSTEGLLDSTAVSFARLTDSCCDRPREPRQPTRVHVLVAAQSELPQALSPLPMSTSEARLIASSLPAKIQTNITAVTSKQVVLDALGERNQWIHVAAHGGAQPDMIGFSGIWLDAPKGKIITQSFMSGVDVLGHSVHSDLVVLGSCALGLRAPQTLRPVLSFADMTILAGARHVVSALWPMSDSATMVWVPAFYREASLRGEIGIDEALRIAQIELKKSRQFRHPFFWASLVHQERLDLTNVKYDTGSAMLRRVPDGAPTDIRIRARDRRYSSADTVRF